MYAIEEGGLTLTLESALGNSTFVCGVLKRITLDSFQRRV